MRNYRSMTGSLSVHCNETRNREKVREESRHNSRAGFELRCLACRDKIDRPDTRTQIDTYI